MQEEGENVEEHVCDTLAPSSISLDVVAVVRHSFVFAPARCGTQIRPSRAADTLLPPGENKSQDYLAGYFWAYAKMKRIRMEVITKMIICYK